MSKRRDAPAGCYWRGHILWGRVLANGREHRWSLDTDDAKTAKARRAAGKARILAVKHGDARHTFQTVAEAWADWIPHQVSANTVKRYAVSLAQLDPFLAGKYLDEINGRSIAEIIRGRQHADDITNATVKRDLVALSSVMNFAIDQGWAESNPILPRLQRIKERRDPIVLPRSDDVETLIARAPGMLANLVAAARATGCRQNELIAARCAQLDLKARRLTLIGKGNKLRVIDLTPFGGAEIFTVLPAGIAKAPLFRTGEGKRFANVSSQIAVITRELAARDHTFTRFRFHDLRHLHAVEWLRSGRSIYDLQHRLGHASITTTEGYLKYLTPEEVRRAKGVAPGTNSVDRFSPEQNPTAQPVELKG
jgi:integrase/recombinase XerD